MASQNGQPNIEHPSLLDVFTSNLVKCCISAPSADNSQPCHAVWDGTAVTILYDAERVKEKTFPPEDQATLISAGALIDNITQLADAYGLKFELSYWPEDTNTTCCYAHIAFDLENQELKTPEKLTIFNRHTNRFSYKRQSIPDQLLKDCKSMGEGDVCVMPIIQTSMLNTLFNIVRSAAEIRFQIQEVHEWLGKSLRFSEGNASTGDGLDVRTLDLPPGGQLFLRFISSWKRMKLLNCIGAYKMLAAIDSLPIKKGPAVLAFIAPNTPQGALDAGRLMNRTWAHLNSKGVACHPYYVISDQLFRLQTGSAPGKLLSKMNRIKEQSSEFFELDDDRTLMILLRAGYPTKEARRSLRLPVEKIFSTSSNSNVE